MSWLQGGPFLEVSFLMVLEADRQSFTDNLFNKLKSFIPTIELASSENDLQQNLREFFTGYSDDETDPNAKIYHQVQIPVYVDIDGKRKSVLSLRQISDKLVAVDFWFFGADCDAPEWEQKGISDVQIHLFKEMLHQLFDTFDFAIGTTGYENSVTDLFDTTDTWPNENYNLDNINEILVRADNYFLLIIVNKKFVHLGSTKFTEVHGNKVVFEGHPKCA